MPSIAKSALRIQPFLQQRLVAATAAAFPCVIAPLRATLFPHTQLPSSCAEQAP